MTKPFQLVLHLTAIGKGPLEARCRKFLRSQLGSGERMSVLFGDCVFYF